MFLFSSEIHQEAYVWVLWARGPKVEYFLEFGAFAPGWWEPVAFM